MSQELIIKRVIDVLEKVGINYMLTGAAAVSFWGKPRSTHDLDLVVLMQREDIEKLAKVLGDEFWLDKEGAKEAIKKREMFNLLHLPSGIKVDCWPLRKDVYSQVCFQRKRREKFLERRAWLISPENLIVTKLIWFKKSGIQKHFEDVRGILQIQKGRLNLEYLQKWAKKQKVFNLLNKLKNEIFVQKKTWKKQSLDC